MTINGQVIDDARIAGAVPLLGENAQVAEDLIGAGHSLEAQQDSPVYGDLLFAGNQALLAGTVAGDVKAAVAGLERRAVLGDVNAETGNSDDAPGFSPFAFMPGAPDIPAGVVAGQLVRQERQRKKNLRMLSSRGSWITCETW